MDNYIIPGKNQGVDNETVEGNEDEEDDDGDEEDNDFIDQNSDTDDIIETESDIFRNAEYNSQERATNPNAPRPKRTAHPKRSDNFAYTAFEHLRRTIGITVSDCDFVHAYVTAQMSAKKGLQVFGKGGAQALMKELRQVVLMKVMSGVKADKMTREQKGRALKYLMFLKEKRCGRIKGHGCADGRKQRIHKTKEETRYIVFHLRSCSPRTRCMD